MPRGVGVRLPEWPLLRNSLKSAIDLISELITSASNSRVKYAASLRESRDRRRENRFLIDGSKNIAIALASGVRCLDVFVSDRAWAAPSPSLRTLLESVSDFQRTSERGVDPIRWIRLSESPLEKLQYGQRDVDAIAVAIPPDTELTSLEVRMRRLLESSAGELYLVLDRMEKPGNLGAAMRTADAAGVTAVLLSDPIGEIWNPNAVRASLGAMFTVPIATGSWRDIFGWLNTRGISVYAARTENGANYSQVRYPEKTAMVIGSEAHGLEDRWLSEKISAVHIPMFGKIDSLNASVTVSILLFEVIRQHPGG